MLKWRIARLCPLDCPHGTATEGSAVAEGLRAVRVDYSVAIPAPPQKRAIVCNCQTAYVHRFVAPVWTS